MKVYRRHTLEPLRYNIFGGWFIVFNFWSNQLLPFKLNRHAQILCMPCKCVLANCLVFFCVNCLADAWHNQMEWYRIDRIGMRKIDFIWNGTLLEANSRYKFKWDVQNVPFEFQSKWEFNNPLREIRYTICTAHTDTAIQFNAPSMVLLLPLFAFRQTNKQHSRSLRKSSRIKHTVKSRLSLHVRRCFCKFANQMVWREVLFSRSFFVHMQKSHGLNLSE